MRWKVGFHDLENGIRVYYFYDSGGTTHICGVGFRIGSVHDQNSPGIAHLAEHMLARESTLFNGGEVYRMIFRYLGGPANLKIETTATSTYYGGPGLYYRKYMDSVMSMMVSLVKDRLIDQVGLNSEKSAVHNELYETEEDIFRNIEELLWHQTAYATNPIRNSILGTATSLQALNLSKIGHFVRRNYVAQNMFAIVFGPNRNDSIAFAKKHLGDWPFRDKPAKVDLNGFDRMPKLDQPRINTFPIIGLSQFRVTAGFPTECYISPDDAALDVIADIVYRRLFDALREKNQDFNSGNYRNPAFTERSLVHGLICGSVATINRDFALYARDEIVSQFCSLKEDLLAKDFLEDYKEAAKEAFFSMFRDSAESVVDLVIEATSCGDPDLRHLHTYTERLNRLTPRKIRDVANKYFSKDKFVSVMLSPA